MKILYIILIVCAVWIGVRYADDIKGWLDPPEATLKEPEPVVEEVAQQPGPDTPADRPIEFHDDPVEVKPAPVAKPKGPVACRVCGGRKMILCPTCRGAKAVVCRQCHGTGRLPDREERVTCQRCGGSGQITVTKVAKHRHRDHVGRLIIDDQPYQVSVPCPACNGRGGGTRRVAQYCPCKTGYVACPTCGGRGAVACQACGGTGVEE